MENQLKTIGKIKTFTVVTASGLVVLLIATVVTSNPFKRIVNVCYCIPEMPSTEVGTEVASICFDKVRNNINIFAFENHAEMGAY